MSGKRTIELAFGRGTVSIDADPAKAKWDVIRPTHQPAVTDPQGAFVEACGNPDGARPLREVVTATDRVTIATSDITRAVPNRHLIPWILNEVPCPDTNVTVLLGNGTHRENTDAEILGMFGPEVVGRVRILNHDAYDPDANVSVGTSACGTQVSLNRAYVEADKRIAVGFIEPHFFAGFSGGPKAAAPGVASIDTIFQLHRAELIADAKSTWGVLEENPLHREVREAVALCPPDFLVNVTLNAIQEISGFYVGHYLEAHRRGCAAVKASSMAPVPDAFPLVVTSNSGYPLDQNLYQTVKGLSAANRIAAEGGAVVVASECSDGVPDHGNFADLMKAGDSPADIIKSVFEKEPILDQWQAQILAGILERVQVDVFAAIPPEAVEGCKMRPVKDLNDAVQERLAALGPGARVAVLPEGPLTIPYVKEA